MPFGFDIPLVTKAGAKTFAKSVSPTVMLGDFVKDVADSRTDALPGISNPWNNGSAAGSPNRTNQPWNPNSAVLGASDSTRQPSGNLQNGGGQSTGPSASDLAQYDLAISQYENQLGRLPAQFDIARGNIDRQYGTSANELQSGYNQAQQQYGQNTTQNQQSYLSNKNQVRDTASAGLRGLLRTLGAYGAGGGSDQQYGTNVVATQAARQNAGAGETFGQNQQQLDSSWGNYGIQHQNERRKLEDWKTGQLQSAEQTSLSSKQSVLQQLATLRAQRAGGNTAVATNALNEANGLQSKIDSLGAMNPTYTGNTPTFQAPDAASYTVDPNAEVDVAENANESITSPYLRMLLGTDKKKQQLAY